MKVVILAGGQGTRLAEETEMRPKPMVDMGGRLLGLHPRTTIDSYRAYLKSAV